MWCRRLAGSWSATRGSRWSSGRPTSRSICSRRGSTWPCGFATCQIRAFGPAGWVSCASSSSARRPTSRRTAVRSIPTISLATNASCAPLRQTTRLGRSASAGGLNPSGSAGIFRTDSTPAIHAAVAQELGLGRTPFWQIRDLVDQGVVEVVLEEFEPADGRACHHRGAPGRARPRPRGAPRSRHGRADRPATCRGRARGRRGGRARPRRRADRRPLAPRRLPDQRRPAHADERPGDRADRARPRALAARRRPALRRPRPQRGQPARRLDAWRSERR